VKRRLNEQQNKQFCDMNPFWLRHASQYSARAVAWMWLPSIAPRAHRRKGHNFRLLKSCDEGGSLGDICFIYLELNGANAKIRAILWKYLGTYESKMMIAEINEFFTQILSWEHVETVPQDGR
jgi:hypothetical protein